MSTTVDLQDGERTRNVKERVPKFWGKENTGRMVFASKYGEKFHGKSLKHLDCQLLDLFLKALIVPNQDCLNQNGNVSTKSTGHGRIRFRKDGGSSGMGQPEAPPGLHPEEIRSSHLCP